MADLELIHKIKTYEMFANVNEAQSKIARLCFAEVQAEFKKRGLAYNTNNLARYGSDRAKEYLRKYPDLA